MHGECGIARADRGSQSEHQNQEPNPDPAEYSFHVNTSFLTRPAIKASSPGRFDPDQNSKSHTCETSDMRSEEHTSELQSLMRISYAVFCLKKKITTTHTYNSTTTQQQL